MGLFDLFKNDNQDPIWLSTLPKDMINLVLSEIRSNSQACKQNEISQGFGDYGLKKTNPIPVFGVPENENYLSKLRLLNGEKIRWRRIGSLFADNIEKPIDEYEIFNLKGDTLSLLYISPYHWKTSQKAPSGFKIVK